MNVAVVFVIHTDVGGVSEGQSEQAIQAELRRFGSGDKFVYRAQSGHLIQKVVRHATGTQDS